VLVSCSLEKLWALFLQYVILATKLRKNLSIAASSTRKMKKTITFYVIFMFLSLFIEEYFVILQPCFVRGTITLLVINWRSAVYRDSGM